MLLKPSYHMLPMHRSHGHQKWLATLVIPIFTDAGLSLRAGDAGYSPPTINMALSYFHCIVIIVFGERNVLEYEKKNSSDLPTCLPLTNRLIINL